MKIHIVGLGYSDEQSLPYGIINRLESKLPIWLRTENHPVVSWMQDRGIQFQTFDHVYEQQDEFAAVYEQITDLLLQLATTNSELIYAVPGHPMVAERTVQHLLARSNARGIEIEIVGGTSFLDGAFTRLQVDPIEGFALIDGSDLEFKQLNPYVHVLISQVYSRMIASDVKLTLLEVYPPETEVTVATALGIPHQEEVTTLPLHELDHQELFTDYTSLYLPPVRESLALPKRFETLVELFAHLRSPDGCPWDRKQTHESLRPYLIEETYEFLEAVATGDEEAMRDELGDVLLQVMLHAQIADESDAFNIYEVIENLAKKMIRRHPHVFDDPSAQTPDEVKQTWAQIKQQENKGKAQSSLLGKVPKGLPALPTATQLQKIAAKVGFDWDRKEEVVDQLNEELKELFEAESQEHMQEELGDVLFTVVNLARFFDVEPETALLDTCQKFKQRFQFMEQKAAETGTQLVDVPLAEQERWWQEAKKSNEL